MKQFDNFYVYIVRPKELIFIADFLR